MVRETIQAKTSYPVECGSGLAQFHLAEIFSDRLSGVKAAVISDREVSGYYSADFLGQFERAGIRSSLVVIDGSQAAKSVDAVKQVYESLTDVSFGEKDVLFALGGGGVQDVAGFVAATFFRGIALVRVPTSLLAMVDSATAQYSCLNFQSYKDRISAHSDPIHTIIDTTYLSTLPARFYANGIAQIIRYGLLGNTELLSLLTEANLDMERLVSLSLATKAELELVPFSVRNFGMEIGAAIEGHFRFLKYSHGEALALGMLAMFPDHFLQELYRQYNLPLQIEGVTRETILNRLIRELSVSSDTVSFAAIAEPGKPYVQTIPITETGEYFGRFLSSVCP